MIAVDFPQANTVFAPPPDLDPEQCRAIRAYKGKTSGGSMDGCEVVVTAWQPTERELIDLQMGRPVFLSFVGGLPPHFVTTDFEQAIRPA